MPLELLNLDVVDGELRERAWEAYLDAFECLRTVAIQRHVMTRAEFDEVMADKRVTVMLTVREDGFIAGIATMSADLTAMPLISPEYFAARWPDHYADGHCWYIGLVGVRPSEQGGGSFALIVSAVAQMLDRAGGVVVLDVPRRNMADLHVPHAVERVASAVVDDLEVEMVDAQGYWAYSTPARVRADVIDLRDRSRSLNLAGTAGAGQGAGRLRPGPAPRRG